MPSPRDSDHLFKKATPLFAFIASLLALLVFLQFYQTIRDSAAELERYQQEKRHRFNARMSALGAELVNNILLCNVYLSEKEDYPTGRRIPKYRFRYSTIEEVIEAGDILNHDLLAQLIAICYQMEAANLMMETNYRVSRMARVEGHFRNTSSSFADTGSMRKFISKVQHIHECICSAQESFENYWQNPEEYKAEDYLQKDLLKDGLMK